MEGTWEKISVGGAGGWWEGEGGVLVVVEEENVSEIGKIRVTERAGGKREGG